MSRDVSGKGRDNRYKLQGRNTPQGINLVFIRSNFAMMSRIFLSNVLHTTNSLNARQKSQLCMVMSCAFFGAKAFYRAPDLATGGTNR